MSGTLYLVGTPIGNLGDLSVRALETLRAADFIAAEDTRVTAKLLNHFEIKKPCVSYYEHNKYASGEKILARILAGETCALVTDAGMPAISDPGEDLVCLCAAHGVEVITIPGPCAAVAALAVSGLPTQRFCFEGFLAVSGKNRSERLEQLKTEPRTMIFYEAPHKLVRTLEDMLAAFGDRDVTIARIRPRAARRTARGRAGDHGGSGASTRGAVSQRGAFAQGGLPPCGGRNRLCQKHALQSRRRKIMMWQKRPPGTVGAFA